MLKIIVVVIGIIAVVGFFMACYIGSAVDELRGDVISLDITAIKKFDPYTKTWDLDVDDLRRLKKALREQGIATDYISENKLDFSECKKTDEEYKKEAEAIVSSVKDSYKSEDYTIFKEVEIVPIKDYGKRYFRCNKCSTVYPLDDTLQTNANYCSFCGRKIVHFELLDI